MQPAPPAKQQNLHPSSSHHRYCSSIQQNARGETLSSAETAGKPLTDINASEFLPLYFWNSLSNQSLNITNTRDLQFLLFSTGLNIFQRFLMSNLQEKWLLLICLFFLAWNTDNLFPYRVLKYRNWKKKIGEKMWLVLPI